MAPLVGGWPPLLAAVALAAVHLLAGRVRSLGIVPRSSWLSVGGGASVAYVFVHLLPELEAGQRAVGASAVPGGSLERYVYLVALAGFVLFYGLEQLARRGAPRETEAAVPGVFWVHLGSFAVYNALIGYLLVHRETGGRVALTLFAVAMGLHFLVNDHGLRAHFRDRYHDRGRWGLSAAVVGGWAVGQAVAVHEAVLHLLFTVLAGGVVLNVIKEELPEHRESRFLPFLAGAGGYAALLLAL